jgi:hypothetical protein
MNAAINYEKSLSRERLIYLGTSRQRMLLTFVGHIQGICLLVASLLVFIFVLITSSQLAAAFSLLPLLLILTSMVLVNKLAKAEGSELRRNQTEMFILLLGMYPGIQRHNCSPHIIIITSEPRPFTLSKEITVLLDDQNVYLNVSISRRGRNIRYILFAIPNYFRTRIVLKHFRRRIKELSFQPVPVLKHQEA